MNVVVPTNPLSVQLSTIEAGQVFSPQISPFDAYMLQSPASELKGVHLASGIVSSFSGGTLVIPHPDAVCYVDGPPE